MKKKFILFSPWLLQSLVEDLRFVACSVHGLVV